MKKEHLKKRLSLDKNVMILLGAVWAASMFLLLDSLSKLSGAVSPMTGFLVSEGAAEAAKASASSLVSAGIYFLGLVIFGGAIFAVSRHSQELRTMLKLEKKERIITGSPRQALTDFFTILSTWSIKNVAADIVIEELNDIKESESKDIPSLSKVSFGLSNDEEIEVKVEGNPDWGEVGLIFETYLTALTIDKNKVINIADYLGKDDVGAILSRLDIEVPAEEKAPARGAQKKEARQKAVKPGKAKKHK